MITDLAATFLGWEMPDSPDDLSETIAAWQELAAHLDHSQDHIAQARRLSYRTRLRCGLGYCLLEDWPQAQRVLEEAEAAGEGEPSLADVAPLLLGTAYAAQGQYEAAIARWTEVLDHMAQSRPGRGRAVFSPQATILYLYRGELYAEVGQYEQAMADCERALRDHPHCAEAYAVRGQCLAYLERYEQAVTDCDRAIELAPDDARVYRRRGRVYLRMREYEKALADFDRALDRDPADTLAAAGRREATVGLLFRIMTA